MIQYYGTGKRKRAIARVYLRPGGGRGILSTGITAREAIALVKAAQLAGTEPVFYHA